MKYLLLPIFVVLLVLKLTGTVSWSWWIILLPMYPALGLLAFAGICAILGLLGFAIAAGTKR